MEKAEIVPDVIQKAPKSELKITYGGGVKVEMGKELRPKQVKDEPTVIWESEKGSFYTLCMTDPDAPSRKDPTYREWHHWLVVNIPGHDIKKGEVLTEYVGAGPPKDSGLHRYVILLYKQPDKIKPSEKKIPKTSGKDRAKFSISKFAERYKLGDPVAGNFFLAEWDDYVPTLYKQLK